MTLVCDHRYRKTKKHGEVSKLIPQYETLLVKFEEYMQSRGFSARTIPDYLHNVKLFLEYLEGVGIAAIGEVDRALVADYQIRLLDQTHRGRPISSVTKLRRLSTVRCFCGYLVKSGALTADPTTDLELPKRPKHLPKNILTKKEMGKLLALPDLKTPLGIRDRAILEVFYSTGIRASELCNLTLNDIDIARGELRINQGKNAKDRVVPLGEVACDYLELYLRKSRKELASSGQPVLFVTKSGKQFNYTTLSHLITGLGQKAGLKKHIASHNLRHTCASHLLQGKADIRHIQEILGHRSLATTQIYTKVEISDLKKVHRRCHPRERKEVPVNDGWV
jgi:integrase/recombinase XerD